MAGRAIISLGEATARNPIEGIDEAAFEACIDSASEMIERFARRRFLTSSYTALHSGDRAARYADEDFVWGGRIWLADPVTLFPTLPLQTITSVTEDGVALTSYRLSQAPALVDGEAVLISDADATLTRVTISSGKPSITRWAAGMANIRVAYTAGYALADVPAPLKEIAIEMTWRLYREARRSGAEMVNDGIGSVTYGRLQMPDLKRALATYVLQMSPVTVES